MVEKIGHIKNPLSVIAMFAGIAEISGTIILPFLEAENQSTYIWFLMLFPSFLVGIFFITLNFNHKTLYAPSDYKDEDNFFKSLSPASFNEKNQKIIAEVDEIKENERKPEEDTRESDGNNSTPHDKKEESQEIIHSEPLRPDVINSVEKNNDNIKNNESSSTSSNRTSKRTLIGTILQAQNLSISKLSKELALNVQSDIGYKTFTGQNVLFDAMGIKADGVHAIEVKYSRNGMIAYDTIDKVLSSAQLVSDNLKQKNMDFTLHFSVVVGERFHNKELIRERIMNRASKFNVKVIVHIFHMRELTGETSID